MSEASQSLVKGGMGRKRYAIVGTGGRADLFYNAIATDYSSTSCIVGLCDTNHVRMDYANSRLEVLGHGKMARDHDAHHELFNVEFGAIPGLMDKLHGTDLRSRRRRRE
ncbi:hypothetical protein B0H65DRAFT_547545 [Neurospora tetraspora]|uniref:Uncharacterized protein n=1 Tax=Neurospora tetraspora TaxID=94610 RepID=A0AAE0JHR3_9PEZI|nr:hypothetical protein B0H65DRAFT_547545 [Neurospora tetraspora]